MTDYEMRRLKLCVGRGVLTTAEAARVTGLALAELHRLAGEGHVERTKGARGYKWSVDDLFGNRP